MPELPEVELMARNLQRWTKGHRVERLLVDDDRLLRQTEHDVALIEGERIQRAYRRAKYAVLEGEAHALVLHFRMTGKVVTELADREAKATILFEKAPPVFFLDTRRFGTLDLLPNTSVESYFQSKGIGPEPWPEKRDGQWWEQQLKGLRGAIKPSLMKQERVAGLGNIMASEILWAARVDPGKNVPDLSSDEWTAIAEAAYEVISRVIAVEEGDEIVYIGDGGSPEASGFSVYAREGEPAPCCNGAVERFVQSGRSTFHCPRCQT